MKPLEYDLELLNFIDIVLDPMADVKEEVINSKSQILKPELEVVLQKMQNFDNKISKW